MKIQYLGHACFLIEDKVKIVFDPFNNIGYDMQKVEADYAFSSHSHFDHNNFNSVLGATKIARKEDCELLPFKVDVIKTYHDDVLGKKRGENLVYKIELEGLKICHLGDLGEPITYELAERIGACDILFLPCGGNYTIDSENAYKLSNYLGAKCVIPMHFKTPRSTVDIDSVNNIKSLYKSIIEVKGQLNITKETMPSEQTLFVFEYDKF